MNSLENNVAKERLNQNNTNLMKEVLYKSQLSLETFKRDMEPDLHPVSNLQSSQELRLIAFLGKNLYSVDIGRNVYSKLSSTCFTDSKKPHHGCAIVSDNRN